MHMNAKFRYTIATNSIRIDIDRQTDRHAVSTINYEI